MKILILEDSVPQAESLGLVLRSKGHQVYLAGDGVQAEAQVQTHRIEAAILDLVTPSMDTPAFLVWLKAQPGYESVPVVISTGLEVERAGELAALPGVRVLRKPYPVPALLAALGISEGETP